MSNSEEEAIMKEIMDGLDTDGQPVEYIQDLIHSRMAELHGNYEDNTQEPAHCEEVNVKAVEINEEEETNAVDHNEEEEILFSESEWDTVIKKIMDKRKIKMLKKKQKKIYKR